MQDVIGRYGSAVIGEDQFALEQAIIEQGVQIYGPAVLVDSPAEKVAELARTRGSTSAQTPAATTATGSVDELKKALATNPAMLDAAMLAEASRPVPRKTAWTLFLEVESRREGGPRTEVVESLNAKIAG